MIDTVLFDIGDTLVHFETSKARRFMRSGAQPAYERIREFGFQPPPFKSYLRAMKQCFFRAYVWSRLRRREVDLIAAFLKRHHSLGLCLSDDQMADVAGRCVPWLRQYFTPDEEAVDVVAALHRLGYRLGLVSNTMFPGFAIDDVLQHDGLLEWFSVRVYSSDVGYMKPNPRIFRIALERLGAAPARTLFVGDRIDKDVKGAGRLGMKTALLRRNGRVPRGRIQPDMVVSRLSELLARLSNKIE